MDLVKRYKRTHDRVLKVASDLSDQQLQRRLDHTDSIAFNVWHLARWADHISSLLCVATPQLRARLGERQDIWTAEDLAQRWGFTAESLGAAQTGMWMDDDVSASLPLPPRAELLRYAERAFAVSADVADAIAAGGDAEMCLPVSIAHERIPWTTPGPDQGTVLTWLVSYYEHDNRHLGMIEAIRGALGLKGTATQ